MPRAYIHEKQVAIEAVLNACELAHRMQGKLEALDVVNKQDLSPVTVTDFSCQALICRYLLAHFPDIPIMGEEDAIYLRAPEQALVRKKVTEQIQHFHPEIGENEILDAIDTGSWEGGSDGRFWVLDPIDGTRGFIRNDQYAIALALIESGKVVLGVLGCPRFHIEGHKRGGIFVAIRGEGTTLIPLDTRRERKIHVNKISSPENVIFCEPPTSTTSHSAFAAEKVAKLLGADPKPFRLDSQVKYAVVADGEASIYLRVPVSLLFREKIWDHAAGMIIVEEAGGKVTDLEGKALDFGRGKALANNLGILATNGLLHKQALEALSKVLLH